MDNITEIKMVAQVNPNTILNLRITIENKGKTEQKKCGVSGHFHTKTNKFALKAHEGFTKENATE